MSQDVSVQIKSNLNPETIELLRKLMRSPKGQKEIIKKLPEVQSFSRSDVISKIQKYYRDQKLVLTLGAGVSIDFGLPTWPVLLQRLMITTFEKEQNVSAVLSKLFTNLFNPSPLIAGRYLQKYYEEMKSSFEEAVRNILYQDLDLMKESPLMDEIVNFCVAPGSSPNLDCIISYNFDDILEQRIKKVGIPIPHTPIFGLGMNPKGKLPIYHVHGYLPQKGKLSENNQITFGESIYHKQYIDIYSWNNIVQINKFRESSCLFIGSSLTDPNIRRLLDIAKRQRGADDDFHFIFKLNHSEIEVKENLKILLNQNKKLLDEKALASMDFDSTVTFLIDIIKRFEESDTSSFGVKTIWVDDWKEIPEYLKEIRES